MLRLLILGLLMLTARCAYPQDSLYWQIQAGMTYSHFQQQVKAKIGDVRGERLSYDLEFGFMVMGTYRVWDYVHAGLFVQFDRGDRRFARFDGFDPLTGRTVTKDRFGGDFKELWIGPFVRAQWSYFFGEIGWGVVGFRDDALRTDLPSATGDTTGTFDLNTKVALYGGLGVAVPFNDRLGLVVRFEYRLRYYSGREGQAFQDNFEHGTQNITPFLGVGWKF